VALSCLISGAQAAPLFERPAGLEQDVDFWRRVFTEIDTHQAFLHDSRHLGVIYEVVQVPENATQSIRRRIADLARERFKKSLQRIVKSNRASLDIADQRVLDLWPEDITNAELKEAAKRIRFQGGLADRFLEGLQRSGAWKPHINTELARYGVPLELAVLPHVESSFNPEARSHVGASGLWQFTRLTGKRFMQVDHVVDERRDPFLSSTAAAKLLADNYSKLESWSLAITAYNHGVGGMKRAVKKIGSADISRINKEYEGRSFGFASRNFYVAFLAALEVEQSARKYFGDFETNTPETLLVVHLQNYVPVATLIDALNISADVLKQYNPALLDSIWQGNKYVPKGYALRIPSSVVANEEQQIFAVIPKTQQYARQLPDRYHKVRRG